MAWSEAARQAAAAARKKGGGGASGMRSKLRKLEGRIGRYEGGGGGKSRGYKRDTKAYRRISSQLAKRSGGF